MNVPPGAIEPELHVPPSAVEVCAVESLLVHITEPPTGTVIGFGEYAVVVNVDEPATMDTETLEPVVGVGAVDGEDEPHAREMLNMTVTRINRKLIRVISFTHESSAIRLPSNPTPFYRPKLEKPASMSYEMAKRFRAMKGRMGLL
jgi:hypothetical protein